MPFLEFIQLQKRRQEYLRANFFRSGNPCTSARAFNRRFVKWGMGVVSGRTGQCRRLIYRIARPCRDPVQFAACNRDSTRAADIGCHAPPRGQEAPLVQLSRYSTHAGEPDVYRFSRSGAPDQPATMTASSSAKAAWEGTGEVSGTTAASRILRATRDTSRKRKSGLGSSVASGKPRTI